MLFLSNAFVHKDKIEIFKKKKSQTLVWIESYNILLEHNEYEVTRSGLMIVSHCTNIQLLLQIGLWSFDIPGY